ncbi:hypothetical protein V499_07672 [Pseudogymnoascus sp. VKM F-103]|nr:hypothetical protein V499_07672 [Pseudogymnoascus sp. VKM F-103]
MPQPQGTTEPTTKPQQGSHRPILPVARKPGTPEASNAILYGATSRDTIAIRSSQGGVASIQSLSALLTSPSNSRVDAVSKSITITVTSAAALAVTSTEKSSTLRTRTRQRRTRKLPFRLREDQSPDELLVE